MTIRNIKQSIVLAVLLVATASASAVPPQQPTTWNKIRTTLVKNKKKILIGTGAILASIALIYTYKNRETIFSSLYAPKKSSDSTQNDTKIEPKTDEQRELTVEEQSLLESIPYLSAEEMPHPMSINRSTTDKRIQDAYSQRYNELASISIAVRMLNKFFDLNQEYTDHTILVPLLNMFIPDAKFLETCEAQHGKFISMQTANDVVQKFFSNKSNSDQNSRIGEDVGYVFVNVMRGMNGGEREIKQAIFKLQQLWTPEHHEQAIKIFKDTFGYTPEN